jgi:hypothetical protein
MSKEFCESRIYEYLNFITNKNLPFELDRKLKQKLAEWWHLNNCR